MTTALTGPAAALGIDMRAGIESYFKYINDNGGVQGQQLELIVRDDGYEPEHAALNMRHLIEHDNVVAVIGNVGTPTAIVTVPIAEENKILLFGAFSGGDVLRASPTSRYVINYRPSYAEETTEMIIGLLQAGIVPTEIAFFTQRDGYGDAAYQGAVNALHTYGFNNTDTLIHGRYTRNTLNVEDAVATLLDADITPKAVIMAGSYAPSAKFITLLKKELPDIWFLNLSFVGSTSLKNTLAENTNKVIVTQVVPSLDANLTIIDEYISAMRELDDSRVPNEVSFEGFIVAKIFHRGLLNITGKIDSESIIDGLESIKGIDIGLGWDIFYDETEHQAIHNLWTSYLVLGEFKSLDWKMLSSTAGNP
ncbi:MAG: ABC transporter substrate-binding protein [Piscirickettsiaceae bacterium]|nr:ABC transporter substrate-binding protein [Piscirickettsiaceae bacterium]